VLGDFGLMKRLGAGAEDDRPTALKESVGPGMPFFYRSPDLVAYARGDSELTTKSDVFQLGLVLAQHFTGRNPQKRAEHDDFLSDVELEPLGRIPGSHARMIGSLISAMLELDPNDRPAAGELLPAWRGVFLAAARDVHALEGRVFF
jgi:serine/threonine protein kinase